METTRIEPIGSKILIRREAAEDRTDAGIFIPKSGQERSNIAVAVAVGPDVERVSPGDRVLIGKWGGSDIGINGDDHIVVKEEDIHGIIKED